MRSTAIRWNFREYRLCFTLQFRSLQSVPISTVSVRGFSPEFPRYQNFCWRILLAYGERLSQILRTGNGDSRIMA
jgi:hypothetical protein